MAAIIHREAIVGPDGRIEISAPELEPGQRVTVTIEPQSTPHESPVQKPHAIDILKAMPGHRLFKTAEEVDEYIREERDSWDR